MSALPLPAPILDDLSDSANEVIQDGGRKRKGHHLAPPPQWGSKRSPEVLVDVISGASILESRRLEDVETPVRTSFRRLSHPKKGVILVQKRPTDVLSYFYFLRSIWSLATPNDFRNGWGSCPLATTGKSISLHMSTPCPLGNCYPWNRVSTSAKTYSTFYILQKPILVSRTVTRALKDPCNKMAEDQWRLRVVHGGGWWWNHWHRSVAQYNRKEPSFSRNDHFIVSEESSCPTTQHS